jgi:hypothetical protein
MALLVQHIDQLATEKSQEVLRNRAELARIEGEQKKAEIALEAARRGVPPDVFDLARKLIWQEGACNSGQRGDAVRDAMSEIAAGGGRLQKEYFGTKDYDRWYDQREDHAYGYGPRHGSMVFRVGLTDEARRRELASHEIEACLSVLNAVLGGGFRMDMPAEVSHVA